MAGCALALSCQITRAFLCKRKRLKTRLLAGVAPALAKAVNIICKHTDSCPMERP